MILGGTSGLGCTSRVALGRASLIVVKVKVVSSFHCMFFVLSLVVVSDLFSGWRVSAEWERKW